LYYKHRNTHNTILQDPDIF